MLQQIQIEQILWIDSSLPTFTWFKKQNLIHHKLVHR